MESLRNVNNRFGGISGDDDSGGWWQGYQECRVELWSGCRHSQSSNVLDPVGIAAEVGVDPRLAQPLGSLPDPLAVAAGEAPEVSLEGAAQLFEVAEKGGFLKS